MMQNFSPRRPFSTPIVRISLMVLSLLIAAAFILDARGFFNKQRKTFNDKTVSEWVITVATSTNRYVDPARRFSIIIPEGWSTKTGADAYPRDVVVFRPTVLELNISVSPVTYDNLDQLKYNLRRIESDWQADTHIEDYDFKGRPAVKRTCRITNEKLFMIDFIERGLAFHFQFSTQPEYFDEYQPLISELLNTIETFR